MRVRVGCEAFYESPEPAPLQFLVRPRERDGHLLLEEATGTEPFTPIRSSTDLFGNCIWRLFAPAGTFRLRYDALVEVLSIPDPVLPNLAGTLVAELPDDVLPYLFPSRHCPSDLLADDAWQLFGTAPDGWARAQAVCDWIHENITYAVGSVATTSADEVYRQRQGVCRDFAQLAVTFCRAVGIPARYVCGYLPDVGVPPDPAPMDFHAWFEAYLGDAWRTFDARHNVPRIARVVIARGRDAVDAAWATVYGASQLVQMQVWADEVAPDATLSSLPAPYTLS
jgi:transglutaminase-like putative cysteine protease